MNLFNEIITLAPRVIANAGDIVEGVTTNIKDKAGLTSVKESKEIERRRGICNNCPFNSTNAKERNGEYERLIKEVESRNGVDLSDIDLSYKTSRPDLHCTLCGCNVDNKTSCLSCNCGIKYFNDTHGTKLELKWTEFKN